MTTAPPPRAGSRAVKLKIRNTANEEFLIGSGYLISESLILTAEHVVKPYEQSQLIITVADGSSRAIVDIVSLHGRNAAIDVVAIRISPGVDLIQKTVGAVFRGDQALERCSIVGFPRANAREEGVPAAHIEARLLPTGGSDTVDLPLQITSVLPRQDDGWKGISGSAVLDPEGKILGIVPTRSVGWYGQLDAVPISAIRDAAIGTDAEEVAHLVIAEVFTNDSLLDADKVNPRLTDIRGRSLFEALHFRNRVVPFVSDHHRARIIRNLLDWTKVSLLQPDIQISVLTGPAGTGKSRLATEICDILLKDRSTWRAGFIDYDKLAIASVPRQPLFAICDYPEREPEAIGEYLARLQKLQFSGNLQASVRFLLLARHDGSWLQRLCDRADDDQALRIGHHSLNLTDFGFEERFDHAEASYKAYCSALGVSAEHAPHLDFQWQTYDRPLTVHIKALLAASGDDLREINQTGSMSELLDRLIRRESKRWLDYRTEGGTQVFEDRRQGMEALCVTTLTAPATQHLPELLQTTDVFRSVSSKTLVTTANALADLYPGPSESIQANMHAEPHVAPVEPDLIAARLLATTPLRPQIIRRLVASRLVNAFPSYHARLLLALMLASDDYPEVKSDLERNLAASLSALIEAPIHRSRTLVELLEQGLASLVGVLLRDFGTGQNIGAVRQAVAALRIPEILRSPRITITAAELLEEIDPREFDPTTFALAEVLSRLAVEHWEGQYATSPSHFSKPLAESYDRLAHWRYQLGDVSGMIESSRRNFEILENHCTDRPKEFLPALARGNFTLSKRLVATKHDYISPFSSGLYAVRAYEQIVKMDEAFRMEYAESLSHYSHLLGRSSWKAKSIAPTIEAILAYTEIVKSGKLRALMPLSYELRQLVRRIDTTTWNRGLAEPVVTSVRPYVRMRVLNPAEYSDSLCNAIERLIQVLTQIFLDHIERKNIEVRLNFLQLSFREAPIRGLWDLAEIIETFYFPDPRST